MKILLIRPKTSPKTIGLQHLMIVEPLELEILYALKRGCDEAVIVDMILEKRPLESFLHEHQPDLLCLTGYITNVPMIIDYCQRAKHFSTKITTIVGGVHCEVCPEDFDNNAVDFRVVRNAAVVFTSLLNHIETQSELPPGVLQKGETMDPMKLPPFNFSIPFADRKATARYRSQYFYIFQDKVALIKTSFGCPFQCSFCFCRVITNDRFHQRPVPEVIAELEQIEEKEIYIVDDDFLFDRKWLSAFFAEIKLRNIKKHYLVYGRADFIAKNPDIIEEFSELGLHTVIIGFESFSDKELDSYNKNISSEIYKQTMDILNRKKVDVFATIIIPPDYDKADFKYMVKSVKSLGIHFVNLQPLTPLPKTGISMSDDQIIIDRHDFEKWDLAHITVQPSKLSVAEYYREILNAYHSILYSPKVLLKYLKTYRPLMLFKMMAGGSRVAKQYRNKIKEAEKHA